MSRFNISNSAVNQVNDSGDNVIIRTQQSKGKSLWQRVSSWYGVVGTTIGIVSSLLGWYALHIQYGWWFFGMK